MPATPEPNPNHPYDDLRGKQVRAYIETSERVFVVEGRLDAYGPFDDDRVMLAIGMPEDPSGGEIHMLANDPSTKITIEALT